MGVCPVGGQTRPTTATPRSTPLPAQKAEEFLKGLEKFLALEHRNRKESDQVLWETSKIISDEPLTSAVAMVGLRLADIPEEKANLARKELAGSWSAIINFYTGFIDYDKMKVLNFSASSKPNPVLTTAHVIFPALNPAFPRPVHILITMVLENNSWKVKSITLLPVRPKP